MFEIIEKCDECGRAFAEGPEDPIEWRLGRPLCGQCVADQDHDEAILMGDEE